MDKRIMSVRTRQPEPRRNYIVRRSLNERLNGILDNKLILIKGSAGSGKTTLITSYLTERNFSNVKWISLDDSCNDLFLFWDYIIRVLAEFIGSDEFIEYFNAGLSRDNLTSIIEILVGSITDQNDIILVLDDFHYITDSAVLDTFELFLRIASRNLHIILITRQEPPIYMSGMGAEANLLFINDHDLRLSKEESLDFLHQTMELKYNEEILTSMAELAEGWVSGLQLITAAFRANGENIGSLKLTNRLIGDYITNEIFEHLSADQQDFLVKTSPLSYFCKEVCGFLFEGIDFDVMIDSFDNMLILCIDQQRGIYRYHNILDEYLKACFRRYAKSEQVLIHQKAAGAFARLGDYDESLRHLLIAQDYNQAMELVLSLPPGARVMSYTGIVPISAAVKNMDFAYQKFFYHYLNLEFDQCREIYSLLESHGRAELNGLGFLIRNEPVDLTVNILTIEKIESLHIGIVSKALILVKNATMLFYHSKYGEALDFLTKALSIPEITRNPFICYYAYNAMAQIYEGLGYLNQASTLYVKMRELIDQNSSMKGLNTSYYIGITGVNMKQMQLGDAKKNLSKAKSCAGDLSDWDWFQQSYNYNMAEYLFVSANKEEAIEILLNLATETSYSILSIYARMIRYAAKYGFKFNALLDRFADLYQAADDILKTGDSQLLYIQQMILKRDFTKALSDLDNILAHARKERIYLKIVEASLMKLGVFLETQASKREVLNVCCEAIHYACDDRILAPFCLDAEFISLVDAGYGKELRKLLSEKELCFYQELCSRWVKNENKLLSTREQEVLIELANGCSNKEIANRLCISMATVKSHLINIYSKLQVNSRVAAAEVARELGLL